MNWDSLVETMARQRAEMDHLARENITIVPDPAIIAVFVRLLRGIMGWRKKELARRASISMSTMERIERGEPVSAESLDRVADALHQPSGAFTAPRVPLTNEEALQRFEERAAPFVNTVDVSVKPLRGHRQVADLAGADLFIVDGGRIGAACEPDLDSLREWLDLTSFMLATESEDCFIQSDTDPMKRRKLYDDVLKCVQEIEDKSRSVTLAGTYQVETGNAQVPKVTAALVAFFPKLTDPAAINRRTLFAPARIDGNDAWRRFREGE